MSLNRYAKRRDKNEPEIIQAFKSVGASVKSIDVPCDLIVGIQNTNILVEVKMPKGRLTPEQKKFMETWKGGEVHVVRTTEEAIQLIEKFIDGE